MTTTADWDLQSAIHDALAADAGVTAIVSTRILDSVPQGTAYPMVVIGDCQNTDSPSFGKGGREMRPEIQSWSEDADTTTASSGSAGYKQAKQLAAAVNAVMMSATLSVPGASATVIRLEDEHDERIAVSEAGPYCRVVRQVYVILLEDS